MALKLLSETAAKITGKTFSRKYIALGRLFDQWEDIMGADMATRTQPMKLHYRKKKNQKERPEAMLEIAASSADAAVLVYRRDLILQRINNIFGDRWVADIKYTHIDPQTAHSIARRRKRPLSEEDRGFLSKTLEQITDPALKERLQRFGEAYLQDKKK
jgi:hypothetical protein